MIRLKVVVRKYLSLVVCCVVFFNIISCGTILYPERVGQSKNQSATDIDVFVFCLDGLWCFAFVIPGLVAWGVDFMTGAIYLPSNRASLNSSGKEKWQTVKVDPKKLNQAMLEKIIEDHTGKNISLNSPDISIFIPKNQTNSILAELKKIQTRSNKIETLGIWLKGNQVNFTNNLYVAKN